MYICTLTQLVCLYDDKAHTYTVSDVVGRSEGDAVGAYGLLYESVY